MKKTLNYLLLSFALVVFTSTLSCSKKEENKSDKSLSELADAKKPFDISEENTEQNKTPRRGSGIIDRWISKYKLDDGESLSYLCINMDLAADSTFITASSFLDENSDEILSYAFSGTYSIEDSIISYHPDLATYTYFINPTVESPEDYRLFVEQQYDNISKSWPDDQIVELTEESLQLKDTTTGEIVKYLRR